MLARAGGPSAVEATTELAHRHATRVRELEHELAWLQAQLADARAPVEAELAAVTAELDRLRALPELRLGQRARQAARVVSRSDVSPTSAPEAPDAPDERARATNPSAPVGGAAPEGSGLGYPARRTTRAVIVVRNRGTGLDALHRWLGEAGITELHVVDNATSDPTTLRSIVGLDVPTHRVERDLGFDALWALGLIAGPAHAAPTLVVDADTLPGTECPDDLLDRLEHELDRDPSIDGVAATPEVSPDGAAHGPALWLVRASAPPPHRMRIGHLDAPYTVRAASWGLADDDPNERFAQLADGIEQR